MTIQQQLAYALLNEMQDQGGHLSADTDVLLRQLCEFGEQPREMLERVVKGGPPESITAAGFPREFVEGLSKFQEQLIAAVKERHINIAMAGYQRVVHAHECAECPDCGEPVCPCCNVHYADCGCPGPTQEDEYDYHEDADGVLWAKRKPETTL